MSNDPVATLAYFFGLGEDVIRCDLERVKKDPDAIHREAKALQAVNYKARSAEIEGKIHHLTMVRAHQLCGLPHIVPEFKTFYAGFGAGGVTQDAEMVAHEKGRLAALSEKMAEIRKREDLLPEEFWYRGEGPDDYEVLENEYGEVSGGIVDTIFVHTLRRYRLNEQADLYEADSKEFEIQREIGRRILLSPKENELEMEELMDSNIRDNYGSDVLSRIRRRVEKLRANNC